MSKAALDFLQSKFGDAVIETHSQCGDDTAVVRPDRWLEACSALRTEPSMAFDMLVDLCAVDYPERSPRFEVVLHLYSIANGHRIRLKSRVGNEDGDGAELDSVTSIWAGANWFERETFDMYGVLFSNHPDLRRLLTDYGFEGYPLRKDFPMTGHVEVRYDEAQKRVVYEPVKLVQEFRKFDFMSPWEGAQYVLPGDEKAKT